MAMFEGTINQINRMSPGARDERNRTEQEHQWKKDSIDQKSRLFEVEMETRLLNNRREKKRMEDIGQYENLLQVADIIESVDPAKLSGMPREEAAQFIQDKLRGLDEETQQVAVAALRGGSTDFYKGLERLESMMKGKYGLNIERQPNVLGLSADGKSIISAPANSRLLTRPFEGPELEAAQQGHKYGSTEWKQSVTGMDKKSLMELELKELQIQNGKDEMAQRRQEVIDAVRAKRQGREEDLSEQISKGFEITDALSLVNKIKEGDSFQSVYGPVSGRVGNWSEEAVTTQARINQLQSVLIVDARGKLRGQGTISDTETKMLADALSILADPRISEDAALEELNRVEGILNNGLAKVSRNPMVARALSDGGIKPAPQKAIDMYKANPSKELADQFFQKYGYYPPEF